MIGTDSPAGSGVQPLGILRVISWIASLADVPPEEAVAMATGNVAALHGLNTGVIAVGREADLVVVDAPLGSQADDALGALAIGDTLAVATAIIDGKPRFEKSRNTPPAITPDQDSGVSEHRLREFSEHRVKRDLDFDPDRSAVVVIDMLNDFLEPEGAMPLLEGRRLYEPIQRLLTVCP